MMPSLLAFSVALSLAAAPDQGTKAAAPARLEVSVTSDGFVVATPRTLKVGQPVTLVVTRSAERTCATDIVLKDFGISKPLPLGKPVEVTFTPTRKGKVHFACAMDMVSGDLTVE
jgi:plastocyanin domain-containing protein